MSCQSTMLPGCAAAQPYVRKKRIYSERSTWELASNLLRMVRVPLDMIQSWSFACPYVAMGYG